MRFAPTTQQANFAGTASFTISNKARQHQSVSLSGSSLAGCLLILPNPLDFGVVGFDPVTGRWCKSTKRTVTVRNICDTQDVGVSSLAVVDLATTAGCGRRSSSSPGIRRRSRSPGSARSAVPPAAPPVTFQVSFEPYQQGKHSGGVKIYTSDLTDPYLIALAGDAEMNSTQTDNFTGHKAAIDVLWVMDTDDDSPRAPGDHRQPVRLPRLPTPEQHRLPDGVDEYRRLCDGELGAGADRALLELQDRRSHPSSGAVRARAWMPSEHSPAS